MTIFEILVVLAASPLIAALFYGTWKFVVDEDASSEPVRAGSSARRTHDSKGI